MSNAIIVRPLAPAAISAISGTQAGVVDYLTQAPGADFMGLIWTSTGTTAQVQLDMGADVTIDTLAMLGLTGGDGASWTLKYATSAQGGAMTGGIGTGAAQFQQVVLGSLYAGSNAPATHGRQAALALISAINARHVRIAVTGAVANAFTAARVIVGQKIQLERNFVFGAVRGVRSFGSVDYSDRGVLLRRQAPKLRGVGLTFSNTYRDEIEATVQPLLERVGNDTPILLVEDPDAHAERTKRIYFGHLDGDIGSIQRNAKCWEWRANLVSLF